MVLTEFPPRIGGMQTHAIHLARRLVQRGWTVEVFTHRALDAVERSEAAIVDHGLPFQIRRDLPRIPYHWILGSLAKAAAAFRPDLVYASTVFYGPLRRLVAVPIVARSVGNDVLRPWIAYPYRSASSLFAEPIIDAALVRWFQRHGSPAWVSRIFQRARHRLLTDSLRQIDLILANSLFTATLLHELGLDRSRVEVVPGGTDVDAFQLDSTQRERSRDEMRARLRIPIGAFVIMTACRLEPKKGVDLLLECVAGIASRIPGVFLLIVGDGNLYASLSAKASALGIRDRVAFAGRVPFDTMPSYFAAADLFVLPSREYVKPKTGLRDIETMGRVFCEANAASVPLIATETGGVGSVVEHGVNGLLCPPEDIESLQDAIVHLWSNPAIRQRLVRVGLDVARQRFNWDVVVDAHERAFRRVMKPPVTGGA